MIVSARLRPSASSRVQPNVFSACAFQLTMWLSASMPTKASCAVSRIRWARASLCATWLSASRRRSSAIATAIRLAVETAKFCSSTVHARGPPTCSTQNTPITSCAAPERHVEHRVDVERLEIRRAGSRWSADRCGRRWRRSRARARWRRNRRAPRRVPARAPDSCAFSWRRNSPTQSMLASVDRRSATG